MQHLNTLWRLLSAASTIRDITQESKTYHFAVSGPVTVYLRAEYATISVTRWTRQQVDVTVRLGAPFGWRIAADQDDAGVYLVAKRRAVLGCLSNAAFDLTVPDDAYLVLKLEHGRLILDVVDATLHVSPPDRQNRLAIRQDNL